MENGFDRLKKSINESLMPSNDLTEIQGILASLQMSYQIEKADFSNGLLYFEAPVDAESQIIQTFESAGFPLYDVEEIGNKCLILINQKRNRSE